MGSGMSEIPEHCLMGFIILLEALVFILHVLISQVCSRQDDVLTKKWPLQTRRSMISQVVSHLELL